MRHFGNCRASRPVAALRETLTPPASVFAATNRQGRIYNHRVKEQIVRRRNAKSFPERRMPASTARVRIQRGLREVVSLHPGNASENVLHDRIAILERPVRILSTLLRLTMVLLRVSGCRLDRDFILCRALVELARACTARSRTDFCRSHRYP